MDRIQIAEAGDIDGLNDILVRISMSQLVYTCSVEREEVHSYLGADSPAVHGESKRH
jgi:hypothetical protein